MNMQDYAHTEHIFNSLKLLNVNDIVKLQELKLYYKYKSKENLLFICKIFSVGKGFSTTLVYLLERACTLVFYYFLFLAQ